MTSTATAGRSRQVDLILAELESLPTLPAIATRLLELTSDADSSTREIIQLIQADPALTAKILSLVRKAPMGVRTEVATIEKAVPLVGFDMIRTAVLSLKVIEVFSDSDMQTSFPRSEFWKHSLAVACAAKLLADGLAEDRINPEEAFVCGLLHDLGKVAFDACLPKSFDRVIRRTNATHGDIREVERALLGLDHTLAGRRLALKWALPASVHESIWLHHHPPEALPASLECPEYVRLVHLADLIVRVQRIGYSGNFRFSQRPWDLAERLEVPRRVFDITLRNLADTIEERAGLIGCDDLTSTAVYVTALASANEELGRLNLDLTQKNQRLEIRSRYLDAMVRLDGKETGCVDVKTVCLCAADALRHGLRASSVLVFTPPGDDLSVHVGLASPDDTSTETLLLATVWSSESVRRMRPPAGIARAAFVPAGPELAPILERYGIEMGAGPLWVLPLNDGSQWVGSAIVAIDKDAIADRSRDENELNALLVAVGLALGAARERAGTVRLAEELAQSNQDLVAAQEQLLRDRSLHMIAEMASGAAHELNNPLAVISGRTQILLKSATDEKLRDIFEIIGDQAHRCSEIVSELVDFAKPSPPQKRQIHLATLLTELRDHWAGESGLGADRFIIDQIDPDAEVQADPDQLREAFDAIVANAVAAIRPEDGKLVINCPLSVTDDIRTIEFADNGCGMDTDVLGHALDPFFSQRPAGRGRGMGLPRAYRLLEINGATLHIESVPDQGTRVFVTLPAAKPDRTDHTDE